VQQASVQTTIEQLRCKTPDFNYSTQSVTS